MQFPFIPPKKLWSSHIFLLENGDCGIWRPRKHLELCHVTQSIPEQFLWQGTLSWWKKPLPWRQRSALAQRSEVILQDAEAVSHKLFSNLCYSSSLWGRKDRLPICIPEPWDLMTPSPVHQMPLFNLMWWVVNTANQNPTRPVIYCHSRPFSLQTFRGMRAGKAEV